MLMINQLAGFGAGGAIPPTTASFVAANGNIADQTSYTFAAQSVGAAAAQRRVIIGVKSQAVDITSVTYNSVAMTRLTTAGAGSKFLSFWEIDEAVLTSTTIVCATSGGTATNCRIAVWNVFGGNNLGIYDQQTATNSTNTVSVTNTCPANSAVLNIAAQSDSTTATNITFTNVTERDDTNPESAQRVGFADAAVSVAGTLSPQAVLTSTGGIPSSTMLSICL